MKKFVIVSDSTCDLYEELRKQYDVEYLPMYMSYDNTSLPADLDWKTLSAKDYYDLQRNGTRVFSSQVPAGDYTERFEQYIKDGYDILSISCSSALSSSVNASMVARDQLLQTYPDAQIVCIDALNCSFGLGILCIYASKLRSEGKDIHQTAQAVEELKGYVNQFGTVDDLKYLKRAGRISSTTATFGTLLNIKPIIVSNTKGENVSVEKAKGRLKSIRRLAELVRENYTGDKVEGVFIAHGDCLDGAEKLRDAILELMPNTAITIGILNPAMGASCGPNTLSLYFVGQPKPDVK